MQTIRPYRVAKRSSEYEKHLQLKSRAKEKRETPHHFWLQKSLEIKCLMIAQTVVFINLIHVV